MKQEPIGANCLIKWLDTPDEIEEVYITFLGYEEGTPDLSGVGDDRIFYYSDGEHDLRSLMLEGIEDFVVVSYELCYA